MRYQKDIYEHFQAFQDLIGNIALLSVFFLDQENFMQAMS